MGKKIELNHRYYFFIRKFFIKYGIDEKIFFKGVCKKWGIRTYYSPEEMHATLDTFYAYLRNEPERFIDYAITWANTPIQGNKEWYEHNNTFEKEYCEWRSIHC